MGRTPAGKKGWFGSAGKSAAALEEEEKWLAWVDGRLVHVLTPNIYRTAGEAVQAFDYITTAGNFSFLERYYPLPMPLNSTHRSYTRAQACGIGGGYLRGAQTAVLGAHLRTATPAGSRRGGWAR
jgi:hypothetical protein